ncbi:MAG TPA: hypothetical protein VMU87_11895 [Stellaceae bacterium]|nr:hypothetical protein [Stellaceae bacterium]
MPDTDIPLERRLRGNRLMPMSRIDRKTLTEITMGNVRREDLNAEEFASLKEVGNGLAPNSISDEHKKRLIELRLVKEELGNLRQTPHGIFIARADNDPLAGMPRSRRDR